MTGERTPASASVARNSDNDISLREHMQRQLDVDRAHADDALRGVKELMLSKLHDVRQSLNDHQARGEVLATERHGEMDRRYEQRFTAQQAAVAVALARVDKEFHEHIQSARDETQAALLAADKAIAKSEASTLKQFEGVNEFRATLTDQAASFMPRKESDVRIDGLAEKIANVSEHVVALQLQLSSRLDVSQGQITGGRTAIQERRNSNAAVYAAIGFAMTALLTVITVVGVIVASRP